LDYRSREKPGQQVQKKKANLLERFKLKPIDLKILTSFEGKVKAAPGAATIDKSLGNLGF